jgi:tRNA pseudouridine55 synthase
LPDGLLVIDKSEGPTSHDVVARLRRALGERRIGHTGTLDPLATGVLPLLVGRATRLAQFLSADDKRYLATIRLGVSTTTRDREGDPVGEPIDPSGLTRERIDAALDGFRGTFFQTPPMYSAKKVGGVSAHRLARRGAVAALAPVSVTVHELTMVGLAGADVRLDLRCSAGFYVRSLAHELGVSLGCGAHLWSLRRTAAGSLTLDDALPLADVDARPELARERMRPMGALLTGWPSVRVTPQGCEKVRRGRHLTPADCEAWDAPSGRAASDEAPPVSVRILDADGDLIALAAWVGGDPPLLHPRVVLV